MCIIISNSETRHYSQSLALLLLTTNKNNQEKNRNTQKSPKINQTDPNEKCTKMCSITHRTGPSLVKQTFTTSFR